MGERGPRSLEAMGISQEKERLPYELLSPDEKITNDIYENSRAKLGESADPEAFKRIGIITRTSKLRKMGGRWGGGTRRHLSTVAFAEGGEFNQEELDEMAQSIVGEEYQGDERKRIGMDVRYIPKQDLTVWQEREKTRKLREETESH